MPTLPSMTRGTATPPPSILFTMRGMDEQGRWLPKSRKVYDLDENGERIRLPSGNWKSHKEDTVDWNDQKYRGDMAAGVAGHGEPLSGSHRQPGTAEPKIL